jgi:sec-independent protein translocase protein TatA
MTNLLIFGIGTTEIILIVLIIVLLFGATKIPALMRGIGQGVKSFRDGMEGKSEPTDEKNEEK